MGKRGAWAFAASFVVVLGPAPARSEDRVDFARDVDPLLKRACISCHSETLPQAGLLLTSRSAALQGGVSGPALVPGQSAASLLLKRVLGQGGLPRMPVGAPLSETETALLKRWIDEGASWPERVDASRTVDFVTDVQPILRSRCARCHGAALQRSQLRLDTRTGALRGGLSGKVVIPGDSRGSVLVQRITGALKPSMPFEGPPLAAEEIARIAAWIDAGAVGPGDEEVVAEKRHWAYVKPLAPGSPVVADAAWIKNPIDGFVLRRLEQEGLRPSAEASRETLIRRVSLDLVGLPPTLAEIDAFLADRSPDAYEKVVDRLLASPHYGERWARPWLDLARYADTNGYEKDRRRVAWKYRDWVIDALNRDLSFRRFTIEQIAGDMLKDAGVEQKIASGFHRNTQLNQEGGIDVEEARWETLVDRVNTTASVWLGSTLGCAQCHNHKYDPFSQADYYRMLAFFDNADYRVEGLGEVVRDKWIVEPELELAPPEQLQKRDALKTEADALKKKIDTADPSADLAAARERLAVMQRELEAIQIPSAMTMGERPGFERPSTPLRIRGSYMSPGERVFAATPAFLPPLPDSQPANRLGLAHWLVDEANPLTARVTVNRYWEQLFGRGLVLTSEDFGTQGEPPTHPELLDWLATTFVSQGWSAKRIQRLMVTSATYRQASRTSPALLERDPENRLLARGPRFRVEAETVRDVALAASGLLSSKLGGPSVFPDQPDGVWDNPYSKDKWTLSEGEDRYRRSLYTFVRRTAPYPMLTTFDAPSREFCTVRRVRTNTPLQALTLLNDPAFFSAARALAGRVLREAPPEPRARAVHAFRLSTARRPSEAELRPLLRFYREQAARFAADPAAAQAVADRDASDRAELAAWTMVANVILNLDETVTKE